jgi:hypothetical protein
MKECERKKAATDLLMYHSLLLDHPAFGHSTRHAELISIDDDTLRRLLGSSKIACSLSPWLSQKHGQFA